MLRPSRFTIARMVNVPLPLSNGLPESFLCYMETLSFFSPSSTEVDNLVIYVAWSNGSITCYMEHFFAP